MKLGRSAAQTERRRVRRNGSLGDKLTYRSQRVDAEANTGRKQEREPRKPIKRFGWLQRLGYIVLSVAILLSAINILTLSSHAKVVPQNDDKVGLLRDVSEYEAAASKVLADSALNRNKITVDTATVQRELQKQFPELAQVDVTIPLLAHRPVIYVQTVRPALILLTPQGAYLIDSNGTALARATSASELSQAGLPKVTDQSGLQVAVGDQALPASQVRFIETVIAQLNAKQYTVSDMTLPASSSELDVRLSGEPYMIKFNLQSDTARQQAGTFLATIARLKRDNTIPAQYIDVRLSGRAYYQ